MDATTHSFYDTLTKKIEEKPSVVLLPILSNFYSELTNETDEKIVKVLSDCSRSLSGPIDNIPFVQYIAKIPDRYVKIINNGDDIEVHALALYHTIFERNGDEVTTSLVNLLLDLVSKVREKKTTCLSCILQEVVENLYQEISIARECYSEGNDPDSITNALTHFFLNSYKDVNNLLTGSIYLRSIKMLCNTNQLLTTSWVKDKIIAQIKGFITSMVTVYCQKEKFSEEKTIQLHKEGEKLQTIVIDIVFRFLRQSNNNRDYVDFLSMVAKAIFGRSKIEYEAFEDKTLNALTKLIEDLREIESFHRGIVKAASHVPDINLY